MLKAFNKNGQWVLATNAVRGSEYYCPECHERLAVVLDSLHKVDHFKHHPNSTCSYGAEETEAHAQKKLDIYSAAAEEAGVQNVSIEHVLEDGQRPDIYFERNDGQRVAVEIQHSPIKDAELIDRTASYSSKKVACVWMPDGIKNLLNTAQADTKGIARVPAWMRRIALLTDNVAYDYSSDETASRSQVVSVGLTMRRRIKRDEHNQEMFTRDGQAIMETYWPKITCHLFRGTVRIDTNESRHKLMLWLPSPVSGEGLVSIQPKKQQFRREITDPYGAPVICNRPLSSTGELAESDVLSPTDAAVVGIIRSMSPVIEPQDIQVVELDNSSEFADLLKAFWDQHPEFTPTQKLWMWGYK